VEPLSQSSLISLQLNNIQWLPFAGDIHYLPLLLAAVFACLYSFQFALFFLRFSQPSVTSSMQNVNVAM
jgi:hypothetical protein